MWPALFLLWILLTPAALPASAPPSGGVPLQGWAAVPSVVRNDGIDAFRLELYPGRKIFGATVSAAHPGIQFPAGSASAEFRDDGITPDRTAGDGIYTAGPFRYRPEYDLPRHYQNDASSPEGLAWIPAGQIRIQETDGRITTFQDQPAVGVIQAAAATGQPVRYLSRNAAAASHLLNLNTGSHLAQQYLRGDYSVLPALTGAVYRHLPDQYDFLFILSTEKRETLDGSNPANATAGYHEGVRIPFTGTGIPPYDRSADFGARGTLQAVNVLDAGRRGLNSLNAVHELLHHWSPRAGADFGFSPDGVHYSARSSAGSLLGGFNWRQLPDGRWDISCTSGATGATQAAPLDLYFMGLIDAAAVPPLLSYSEESPAPLTRCGGRDPLRPDELTGVVTADRIERHAGARQPGPSGAQRDFRILFVVETSGRLLTEPEMAFYNTLAAHFTRALTPQDPTPRIGQNWVSIQRFFGHGTHWRSDVGLVRPETLAFVSNLAKSLSLGLAETEIEQLALEIDSGAETRARIAARLAGSPEFLRPAMLVVRAHRAVFGRDPSVSSFHFWMDRLRSGLSEQAFFSEFLRQPEFVMQTALLDHRGFARTLHRNLFGTEPPPALLDQWTAALNAGYSRLDFVVSVFWSPAFQAQSANRAKTAAILLALAPAKVSQELMLQAVAHFDRGGSLEDLLIMVL